MEDKLFATICVGDTSEALTLLEASDVSEWINEPRNGYTCLWLACNCYNKAVVNKLLKVRNIDINKSVWFGSTPLHIALIHKNTELVEQLLSSGVVCQGDKCNYTPLHLAAYNDDTDTLECLLNNSRKHINTVTTGKYPCFKYINAPVGATALHVAALQGNLNATKMLVQYGADITIKAEGKTPYGMAVNNKHQHVADFLKKISADKSTTNELVSRVNTLEIKCDHLQSQNNELKARLSTLEKTVRPKTNNSNNQKPKGTPDVQCIQNHFTYLLDHMCADDHLDYLYQERALTFEDYEDISCVSGNTKRTREMLKKLIRKNNPECIKVLRKSIEGNAEYLLHIFN